MLAGKQIFDECLLPNERLLKKASHLVRETKNKDNPKLQRLTSDTAEGQQSFPWEPRMSSDCLVFTSSVIEQNSFYISETKETLYKLSGAMRWDEPFALTRYHELLSDNSCLELQEGIFYGFAKTGGALLLLETDNIKVDHKRAQMEKQYKEIIESFNKVDFWSFLLALHQRHTLMRFSYDLAAYVNSNNKRKINELRHLLLEFTTIGWFSQVSYNETSMEVYRHWRDVFENTTLYDEVFNALAAEDDYISIKRTRRIEFITAATLPLAVMGTIFGSNFDLVQGLPLWPWWALGISLTLIVIWSLWYWFSMRQ
jgi:hypothetical protein